MTKRGEMSEERIIDGYRILRTLGTGAAAVVYEAEEIRFGTHYALKLVQAEAKDSDLCLRFQTEALLLAKLNHPRIVRVRGWGTDAASGRPYYVMDLVLGPDGAPHTLADAKAAGVDEDQVAVWYDDLRLGLGYLHGKGVIHRDLKLQNVLVGADGHAVLSDFGVAKIFDGALRSSVTSLDDTIGALRRGTVPVMGTVGYMPPETGFGTPPSPATDYYSLGVIVFYLLTGLWCDARTDLKTALDGYDPVWCALLTELLHANPAARKCSDRAAFVAAERAAEAVAAERTMDILTVRCRRLRHMVCVCLSVVIALIVAWCVCETMRPAPLVSFEDVCSIPADAPDEETLPAKGRNQKIQDSRPTRQDYENILPDVWTMLRPTIEDLRAGKITFAKAAEVARKARLDVTEDSAEAELYRQAETNFTNRAKGRGR